jgi:hypothetical protein
MFRLLLITMVTVKPMWLSLEAGRGMSREAETDFSALLSDNQETNPFRQIMTATVELT